MHFIIMLQGHTIEVFASAIWCLFLTCATSAGVNTSEELIKLFSSAKGTTLNTTITLLDDLDFSHSNLTFPLGTFSNGACISYSGVFQGNGHSIKGLVMNNQDNAGYRHAGLFCKLENATISSLVIDSSCSFTGYYAGALGVRASRSLHITMVSNMAQVFGEENAGGFVGSLEQGGSVLFDNCHNQRGVTGSSHAGGFIGSAWNNTNTSLSLSNCWNKGNISGSLFVGGLIGQIASNINVEVTISNSINSGNITGIHNDIGGLIGLFNNNENMNVQIMNCSNYGPVKGQLHVGGFVGFLYFLKTDNVTFVMINSENKGDISATSGMACGFFFVVEGPNATENTTVINNINKGRIYAQSYGYGIANNVSKVRNVVSMGEVAGLYGSYTFWKASNDADLFYGLNGKCFSCDTSAILFELKTSTGLYEIDVNGEYVDDILNDKAVNQHFGMLWTKQLDLVHKMTFTVNVSGLLHASLLTEPGTPLNKVANLSSYFNNEEYGIVSEQNGKMIQYDPTYLVSRNMNLIVGKWISVTVCAPINKSMRLLSGKTLDQLAQLFNFSLDGFVVIERNADRVLNKSTVIEADTTLKLCHFVNISGVLISTIIVEHGTQLG